MIDFWKSNWADCDLEAAPGAVTTDDADMRLIETHADEAINIVVCEIFHHTQLFLDGSSDLFVTSHSSF